MTQIIATMSLSGGQGKTTSTVFLAKALAEHNKTVLGIDADPQSNFTTFLGHDLKDNDPTLLEVLKGSVKLEDGIYPTKFQNIFLIPSDDGLDVANEYLSSSGFGAMLLKKRLELAQDSFDFILIDSPPQRSQICKSIIGAAQHILIPCEATVKGYGSLVRTLDAIEELNMLGAANAAILGIIPFRDRWVGNTQTNESKSCIQTMADEGVGKIFPSILESEQYKKAIRQGQTLAEIGHPDLAHPFSTIVADLIGGQQ